MKIYTNIEDKFLELEEISFLIDDIDELVKLNAFIATCIDNIKCNDEFNHEHFSDFFVKDNLPEIIVCKG